MVAVSNRTTLILSHVSAWIKTKEGLKMTVKKKGQWGGKRLNQTGRPKNSDEGRTSFAVSCTREERDEIQGIANEAGMPKSRLIIEAVRQYRVKPRKT